MKTLFKGLTYPRGFQVAIAHVPIKRKGPDILLLTSDKDAPYSAVFTTNNLRAFCVERGYRQYAKNRGILRAILVNSGNANAVTGERGKQDTLMLCEQVAKLLNIDPLSVLMCSTGVIGELLPVEKMKEAIDVLSKNLSPKDEGSDRAILTTDTCVKSYSDSFIVNGKEVRLSAIAKGSGMIHPQMATMLAFITTDCCIDKNLLDKIFRSCVDKSFHAITVDADQSTNDTAVILSSGLAENNKIVQEDSVEAQLFQKHLFDMMIQLAWDIISDGEGATKLIEVTVSGANSDSDAKRAAMSIATSSLVKTAMFGEDPNWGRIMSSLGASHIQIDPKNIQLFLQGYEIFSFGKLNILNKDILRESMKQRKIEIKVLLNQHSGEFTVWTSDLSHEYVTINSKYHT